MIVAEAGLAAALREALGDPARVREDAAAADAHAGDISYHRPRRPDFVVYPESTAEVQAVLRLASEHGIPVVPFGAGTSVEGHVIPVAGGISLDLTGMNRILEVRPDDLVARVEAGVTRLQLDARLREEGLFFPLDPGADATLGGMAATNASGTNALRYGVMRDSVLGLEVVLADGTVQRTGTVAAKSCAGYDVTRLFVGSEGTLGVITELILRVRRLPAFFAAGRAVFADVDAAARAATRAAQAGLAITRLELVDERAVAAVNAFSGTAYREGPTLFVELAGSEAGVRGDLATATELFAAEGAVAFDAEEGEEARERLWDARHQAAHAVMATAPGKKIMTTDVCVPVSRLAEAIAAARAFAAERGVDAAILGHVGDGNYHAVFMVDPEDEAEVARAEELNAAIVRSALALGGTCTGEHGIGLGKIAYLAEEHAASLELMRRLKRALDPQGIMNPGKVLP